MGTILLLNLLIQLLAVWIAGLQGCPCSEIKEVDCEVPAMMPCSCIKGSNNGCRIRIMALISSCNIEVTTVCQVCLQERAVVQRRELCFKDKPREVT
jgi:hypothetical protein